MLAVNVRLLLEVVIRPLVLVPDVRPVVLVIHAVLHAVVRVVAVVPSVAVPLVPFTFR